MHSLLRILHESPEFVVVDKPSGLLSVPGRGAAKQDCVASRVLRMFPLATGPLVVHRLDMDTSGLLVVALTPQAQRELSRQFEQREVQKAYVAMLNGTPPSQEGCIDLPIRTDIDNRPRQIVDFTFGKPSQTRYRVLSCDAAPAPTPTPAHSRVRFEPVTGRSHQLRVHAASPTTLLHSNGQLIAGGLGCPILGDPLYGDAASAPRLLLHACELAFKDPQTGASLAFTSEPEF